MVLIGLSIVLLLFGGGFFPPLIGLIAGVSGFWIRRPIRSEKSGIIQKVVACSWPWPLVLLVGWLLGEWLVGYLWNDILIKYMIYGVVFILVMLIISVNTGLGGILSMVWYILTARTLFQLAAQEEE